MKSVDCDIIRDLLPGYSDKILSEESNKLVRKHLQTCDNCLKELQDMNKEIPNEIIENQEEQIDFLKGYRKSKIISIVFAIILTLCMLITTFIGIVSFEKYAEFSININEIDITCTQKENVNGKERLVFNLYSEDWNFYAYENEIIDSAEGKTIHCKIVGKYPLFNSRTARYYTEFHIDENIEKIYFENKKGELKEIWNRDLGVLTRDMSSNN